MIEQLKHDDEVNDEGSPIEGCFYAIIGSSIFFLVIFSAVVIIVLSK